MLLMMIGFEAHW